MPARKDRTGETTIANNGMKMTIIAYRNSRDIDVQFDDGAVRKGVKYQCFIKGKIRHPSEKDRTGETSVANNGMTMTIIAYRNSRDIDVQFEDGTIRKGVGYFCFKRGEVDNPNLHKSHIGKTSIASNGMIMTIIAYRNCKDFDIQFEDGAIRKNVRYNEFKKGQIRHPKEQERLANLSESRIGETSIALNGMTMTIIAYRSCNDIDVQFEDGNVCKSVPYGDFKKGSIRHPEKLKQTQNLNRIRAGETNKHKNGMTMTIIAYRRCDDMDVQFEDGAVIKGVSYHNFKNGNLRYPIEIAHIGETAVASNGMKITIIAYRRHNDIDVQFEDGKIRKGVSYTNFKKGYVSHPNEIRENLCRTRVGETATAINGMKMTIIAYRNKNDLDVQFEDGKIREGVRYESFKKGVCIKNPHFPMHGKGTYKTFETQYAYTAPDGSVYFYCECQKCGWKKNLTARELINLNHTCENIEGSET